MANARLASVRNVAVKHVRLGSTELTHSLLLIDLKDLVQQRILAEVSPPTPFMQAHDAAAKDGYIFDNKVMQRQITKLMLDAERTMIIKHIDGLRAAVKMQERAAEGEQKKPSILRAPRPGGGDASGAAQTGISTRSASIKRGVRIRTRVRSTKVIIATPQAIPDVDAESTSG